MVQTTEANGGVTQIQLDPAGNRTALVDPDNNQTTWTFDALNRETSEKNALNFSRTFSYDASSDLISETDRDNRTRDFVYDNLHQLTNEDTHPFDAERTSLKPLDSNVNMGILTAVSNHRGCHARLCSPPNRR